MHIIAQKGSTKKSIQLQNMKSTVPENALPGLEIAQVRAGVEALISLLKASKDKSLLDEAEPVLLQVCCIKIPKTPTRQVRFLLPHSMVTDLTEVCLLVRDLKKGKNVDHEPTIDHYKDLLRSNGITVINEVISLRQLKVEYDQYEMRRRLCCKYDMFLADGRVSGHMRHLLGREFLKKKKVPTPINLDSKHLKDDINRALSKTVMTLHGNGDTFAVTMGHSRQTCEELTANILAVAAGLDEHFPGGWSNIRSLRIKTALSSAIPVFFTFQDGNEIDTPIIKHKRPKAAVPVEGELSSIVGARVTVYPSGNVRIHKDEDSDEFSWSDASFSDDEEIREVLRKKRKVDGDNSKEVENQPASEEEEENEKEEKTASSSEDEDTGLKMEEETYLSNWHQKFEKSDSESHSTRDEHKTKKKLSRPQIKKKETKEKKKVQKQEKSDPTLSIKKKSKTVKILSNKSKLKGK